MRQRKLNSIKGTSNQNCKNKTASNKHKKSNIKMDIGEETHGRQG